MNTINIRLRAFQVDRSHTQAPNVGEEGARNGSVLLHSSARVWYKALLPSEPVTIMQRTD